MKTKQEIIDSHESSDELEILHNENVSYYSEVVIHKMLDEYMREYLEAVVKMREIQNEFDVIRGEADARNNFLARVIQAELQVDIMTKQLQGKSGEQKEML